MKVRELIKRFQTELPEEYLDAEFSDKLVYDKLENLMLIHFPDNKTYIYSDHISYQTWYVVGKTWCFDHNSNYVVVEKSEDGKEVWVEKVPRKIR